MSPEQCAKSGSEDGEQAAVFCWAAEQVREGGRGAVYLRTMFAIPNGGSRGGTKDQAMAVGARLKATGVKPGVSDIFLPAQKHGMGGLFLEMKKSREHGGGVVSKEQKAFGTDMQDLGYGFVVCYGWQEAVQVLKQYLDLE